MKTRAEPISPVRTTRPIGITACIPNKTNDLREFILSLQSSRCIENVIT
jgi:hypothetical protein